MQPSQILRLVLLVSCLKTLNGAPVDNKEERFAVHYLKEYGYLSPLRDGNHNFKDAVRIFQQHSDIPDTGHLDSKTMTEMHKPRCGVPDFDEEEVTNSGRQKRFSTAGTNWTKHRLTYRFHNYASKSGLSRVQQHSIMQKAFKEWQDISPLSFTDVTGSSSSADITISFFAKVHSPCLSKFDDAGGSLAHAFFPQVGTVHFDDDETFTDGTSSGINLFSVALHEIGHLLGLKHSRNTSAIMHETYKGYNPNMKLTEDEKHGIDYIYAQGTATPDTNTSQCSDKMTTCSSYKQYCIVEDPDVASQMKQICPQTCGLCGGQGVSSSCTDKAPNWLCTAYESNDLCNKNNAYVDDNCQKTCKYKCTAG
ncbi:hypothetical protein ACROYT_G023132 [Oculina patagonica]